MKNNLYRHRKYVAKISQAEMSDRLNIKQSAYCRYESGVTEMRLSIAYQIAKELNITIDQLYKKITSYKYEVVS